MSARNIILFLMFGGLLYGAYYLYRSHTTQPLAAEMIRIDTAKVNRLLIHPPSEAGRLIQLQREGDSWIASNGQVHLRALYPPVQELLRNLILITTIDIAAKSESEWSNYGLASGQAVRLEVYENDQLVKDFWIGQPLPSPGPADSLAFIRIHEEQEVYAVQGISAQPFQLPFLGYRPKTILALPDAHLIDSFSYQLPDTVFIFERKENQWRVNGSDLSDPEPVNRYLQELQNVKSNEFVDNFDENQAGALRFRSLNFFISGSDQPTIINSYADTLREHPFILHSTQNPGSWFASDSSGVVRRFFREMDYFFPMENKNAPVN